MTARASVRLPPALAMPLAAVVGAAFAPHGIEEPVTAPYAPPGPGVPLGGDQLGRDVLSRLLAGGRELLLSSVVVAVLVTGIAAVLGALAALRPALGALVEAASDILILLPAVLAILVIGASWPGSGRTPVIVAAVVLGTPFAFRVTSAAAAPVAASGFVEVAASTGETTLSLAVREILPNLRATLLALLGLRFVEAIYVVATAGFLEVGVQPPAADWALMIRENAEGALLNPWGVAAPGLAIAALALSANLAFEALTPRARHRTVARL